MGTNQDQRVDREIGAEGICGHCGRELHPDGHYCKEQAVDQVADVLLKAHRHGVSTQAVIDSAKRHYEAERGEFNERAALQPIKTTPAEEALTQIQHIAYDGQVQIGKKQETGTGFAMSDEALDYVRMLEAKVERICNIAEVGAPDEDWRPLLENSDGDIVAGGEADGPVEEEAREEEERVGEQAAHRDDMPSDTRSELAESGWPVAHMTDAQAALVYEAEGDRNHEEASGESKWWEHQIQPFVDTLHEVRALAVISEDADAPLMRARLAVIRGMIPPAIWTLLDGDPPVPQEENYNGADGEVLPNGDSVDDSI